MNIPEEKQKLRKYQEQIGRLIRLEKELVQKRIEGVEEKVKSDFVCEEAMLGQGVYSTITFPLGQDEVAVSRAIHDLLNDGWRFHSLTKTKISFNREWRA